MISPSVPWRESVLRQHGPALLQLVAAFSPLVCQDKHFPFPPLITYGMERAVWVLTRVVCRIHGGTWWRDAARSVLGSPRSEQIPGHSADSRTCHPASPGTAGGRDAPRFPTVTCTAEIFPVAPPPPKKREKVTFTAHIDVFEHDMFAPSGG